MELLFSLIGSVALQLVDFTVLISLLSVLHCHGDNVAVLTTLRVSAITSNMIDVNVSGKD